MSAKKATELVPTMIRIREWLRKKLEKAAKEHDCSINQEITQRLEYSFVRDRNEARDTAVVDLLVSENRYSRHLIHRIVLQLQAAPKWSQSEKGIEEMAARIDFYVRRITKEPYADYEWSLLENEK